MKKIKTVDILAREWFDKINGNSYFSLNVTVNFGLESEANFYEPMTYGYGSQYETNTKFLLMKHSYIKETMFGLYQICKENKIIIRSRKLENCKKADL